MFVLYVTRLHYLVCGFYQFHVTRSLEAKLIGVAFHKFLPQNLRLVSLGNSGATKFSNGVNFVFCSLFLFCKFYNGINLLVTVMNLQTCNDMRT